MSDFHGHTETTSSRPRPDWPIAVISDLDIFVTPIMPSGRRGPRFRRDNLCKPVAQYSMEGEFMAHYPSTNEAGRMKGFIAQNVAKAARGVQKTAHGFIWKYIPKENVP